MHRGGRGIFTEVCVCVFSSSFEREENEKKVFFSLLRGQVDLETRPRSILEEKKDTGLN